MKMSILGFLFLNFLSLQAQAGAVVLKPSGMYWSHQFKNGQTPESITTLNHFDASFGLGYVIDLGIYIGGTYTWNQEETKAESASAAAETKSTHTGYGPTLGLMGSHIYLLGTYLLSPVHVTGTDAAKSTYYGGSGYQVDLGIIFSLTSGIAIGPQFTYYHAEFKKLKDNAGIETELSSCNVSDLRPMVTLAFVF